MQWAHTDIHFMLVHHCSRLALYFVQSISCINVSLCDKFSDQAQIFTKPTVLGFPKMHVYTLYVVNVQFVSLKVPCLRRPLSQQDT
jgi:hypothetical protein